MVSLEVAETTVGKFEICGLKFVVSLKGSHDSNYSSLWLKRVLGLFCITQKNVSRGQRWEELSVWDLPDGKLRFFTNSTEFKFLIDLNTPDEEGMVASLSQAEVCIVNQVVSNMQQNLWLHGASLIKGKTIVFLVAPSGGGKTTLSLGLLGHGFSLLTDDVIIIDKSRLTIQPFPRCPKIRPTALEQLSSVEQEFLHNIEMAGRYVLLPDRFWVNAAVQLHDLRKRIFILSQQQTPNKPHKLDRTEMMIELARHSNFLHQDDDELSVVSKLLHNTTAYKLPITTFKDNISQILKLGENHQEKL